MALPIVAVVGRPNVGKSTLVNRIAERADAIVHEQPGVTRDRSYHRAEWNGRGFLLVDTGGIERSPDDPFAESITAQALLAAEESDVIIVLVDGTTGVTAGDQDVARTLKRSERPVFLVVNKVDTPGREESRHEFWALGLGEPWAVSALHGHGTGDLLDAIVDALPSPRVEPVSNTVDVAIIGKPNAGKSSLLNRLAGTDRAIVSEVPGTTRDALDIVVERGETHYRFVDTAGIRRKAKIDAAVEYYGFVRAMRAIDRADIALLVIDATTGVTDQDQRVARFAAERACGLIVVLNKWDLVTDDDWREELGFQVEERLGFVSFAPVLRMSALTGAKVDRTFRALSSVWESYTQTISTSSLNRLLTEMREFGHSVSRGGRTLRLRYVTQTGTAPPEFTLFANHPVLVDDAFRRYVENRFRGAFELTGTPIVLKFRRQE
ncbi:MAG TPA: ribosome biogenesis GTPase Der [Coriobacteriia bacterium]|nr:ribosome biogenesis GTPase Der [Coriobacteriia bacterium]